MGAWIARFIATMGGIGEAPIGAGTIASVVAALVWYALPLTPAAQMSVTAALTLAGLWASDRYARAVNTKDPSQVVIDEGAGMWLALLNVPHAWPMAVAAVALFRVFDIVKPPPIRQIERLPGGLGIMMDDVAAGLAARGLLALFAAFFAF